MVEFRESGLECHSSDLEIPGPGVRTIDFLRSVRKNTDAVECRCRLVEVKETAYCTSVRSRPTRSGRVRSTDRPLQPGGYSQLFRHGGVNEDREGSTLQGSRMLSRQVS